MREFWRKIETPTTPNLPQKSRRTGLPAQNKPLIKEEERRPSTATVWAVVFHSLTGLSQRSVSYCFVMKDSKGLICRRTGKEVCNRTADAAGVANNPLQVWERSYSTSGG